MPPFPPCLPINIHDFAQLRRGRFTYIDKTRGIEFFENHLPKLILTRATGFGKTLFASTLAAYYDRRYADDFENLFGGTYIAGHKTPLAHQFAVLRLNLPHAKPLRTQEELQLCLRKNLSQFFSRYPHPQQQDVLSYQAIDAADLIARFFAVVHGTYRRKLCVIVDDCEPTLHPRLSAGEAHAIRTTLNNFYAEMKIAAGDGTIGRLWVFGPQQADTVPAAHCQLDTKDLTMHPQTAGLFGFSPSELRSFLGSADLSNTENPVAELTRQCTAYHFSRLSDVTVFNSADCLQRLTALAESQAPHAQPAESA